jgi:hypothetical protein
MKNHMITSIAVAMLAAAALAEGPGGGMPPGGGGNQPGGNQPGGGGSSATFTFDTFLASSDVSSGIIVREGVLTGHSSPTSATVPSSVTKIAEGALAGCTTLTLIDLSETSITAIPNDAFSGCTSLATVVLPATCTEIGANAFAGCVALSTLTAPGLATIGADAFRGCDALASVPSSATEIGDYAFAQSGIESVSLSGTVAVGEGAFSGCTGLDTVTVQTDASLPAAVFSGCTALDVSDWAAVATFGRASLAGIPAVVLTVSPSATIGEYAFAADEATVQTTLAQSDVPLHAESAFLGREVSYMPDSSSVTRIEAMDLVEWLSDETASSAVTHPSDYNTATLKSWLSSDGNAYAYAYADDLSNDAAFAGLTVDGQSFIYNAPTDAALSIGVTPVAAYELSADASDWSADNLVWSDAVGAYVAADETDRCFVRLRFTLDW